MEDRLCMMQECMSYHATMKGFSEILGVSDDDLGVYPSLPQQQQPQQEDHGKQEQPQQSFDLNSEEYQWMNGLLSMEEAVAQLQELPSSISLGGSDFSPPLSSDSSGNSLLSPPQSCGQSSNNAAQDPFSGTHAASAVETPPSSVNSASAPLNFDSYEHRDNVIENGRFSHQLARGAMSENSELSTGSSTKSGRFKRAASQRDSASRTSMGLHSSVDASSVEVISFVQNKDLNAERYAKILQDGDGSFSCNDVVHKLSPTAMDLPAIQHTHAPASSRVDFRALLLNCAQAIAADNLPKAHELLQEIRREASPYGSGLQRMAHYYAEGLVARLSGTGARLFSVFTNNAPSAAKLLRAHHLFVEVCPSVKVSHYFANKAILQAAEGASRLHIVDYGILYGLQWPCLISALAERKGGPPHLRITGIDFPQPGFNSAERVAMTGRRLAEYAKTYGVPFQYRAVASKWENIHPSSLQLRQDEVLVVNSLFRMRHLLDETVMASNPRLTVLSRIRSMKPKVFVQGVKNGSHNAPFFVSRFRESLSFFTSKFDMLDVTMPRDNQERMMIEREVLGKDILNVVACEGAERIERPETYKQWQNRTQRAGFEQVPLDQNVVNKAQQIVRTSYHKDFGVEEDGRWMLLSWKGRILQGLSLWKPALMDAK